MDIQSGFSSVSSMHDVSSGETSHVLPTLDSFRNKLLDLTTRNNLLNLGLNSKRTSRLMRFIDCNLQSVLDGLVNGRQYTLQGLPEPPIDKQLEFND